MPIKDLLNLKISIRSSLNKVLTFLHCSFENFEIASRVVLDLLTLTYLPHSHLFLGSGVVISLVLGSLINGSKIFYNLN